MLDWLGGNTKSIRAFRWFGNGLIAISGTALAVAVVLPVWAMPRLMKLPVDISADTVSVADQASVIDVESILHGKPRTQTGVPLSVKVYVKTGSPSDSHRVTLLAATKVERLDRAGANRLVSASVDRVTLDRNTARPVDEPAGAISLEMGKQEVVPRTGLQYQFPFDTRRESYPYFDDIARTTGPIDYVDDRRVEAGMRLLHFHQQVGPVNLHITQPSQELTLPASSWGLPGDEPTRFDLWYSNNRDIWVEPTSGMIVAVEEHPRRQLARFRADPLAVTTLDACTRFDKRTLTETVRLAQDAQFRIQLGRKYLPAGLAVGGACALVTAFLVSRRHGVSPRQR